MEIEDLRRLKAYLRAKIRDAMENRLRNEPKRTSKSRIKRLRGLNRPQYRLRVDDVRVFYDVADDKVEILAIVAKPNAAGWLEECLARGRGSRLEDVEDED